MNKQPALSWSEGSIILSGAWNIEHHQALLAMLKNLPDINPHGNIVAVNGEAITDIDMSGLTMLKYYLRTQGVEPTMARFNGLTPDHECLMNALWSRTLPDVPINDDCNLTLIGCAMAAIGRMSSYIAKETVGLLVFTGKLFAYLAVALRSPSLFRGKALIRHMDESGVKAIPIIAMLAFLISIVLAYQGAIQLAMFGADIFTIDLTAVSILRDMAVLLTAIMVAGRSGSAFAAEIGVMKLRDEVNALHTLGLNPMHVLIIPRVLAVTFMMPVLTFIADICGLIGTAGITYVLLDISLEQFVERCANVIGLNTFLVGLVKAPVFGLFIGIIGTYQGMQVDGSAESVGRLTTASVVQSIFVVIMINALFSILFSSFGL